MPTFIKTGFWEKAEKGFKGWLDLDLLIESFSNASWGQITGNISDQNDLISLIDSKVSQTITNGVTTSAPSQDAVFDALALKSPILTASDGITKQGNNFVWGGTSAGNTITSTGSINLDANGSEGAVDFAVDNQAGSATIFHFGANPYFQSGFGFELFPFPELLDGRHTLPYLTGAGYSMKFGVVDTDFTDTFNFYLESSADVSNIGSMTFTDNRGTKKGIQYAAAGYVTDDRSLVDKEYSDNHILKTFTVGTVPSAATYARGLIYVSNESGGAVPAFSDGTNWRRVTDRAIIS